MNLLHKIVKSWKPDFVTRLQEIELALGHTDGRNHGRTDRRDS